MSRLQIAAGNWKMNKTLEEAMALTEELVAGFKKSKGIMILATPYVFLHQVAQRIKDQEGIYVAAQNVHQKDNGAFTGEISIPMLQSIGVTHVILGHSERRAIFKEDNELLTEKVDAVLAHQLTPIFCCGEKLEIREAGDHVSFVKNQLKESLFHLSAADFSKIIIAYEPVWAIGTGKTASPGQAQDMHLAIRQMVAAQYGEETAQQLSILYGGSVKPKNAKELFGQADVDGGLVGGASLQSSDFLAIYDSL